MKKQEVNIDQRMLELYSKGYAYFKIHQILNQEYDQKLVLRNIGEKMGELKKQMKCATQFQMGFEYANSNLSSTLDMLHKDHQYDLEEQKHQSFMNGLAAGKNLCKPTYNDEELQRRFWIGFACAAAIAALLMLVLSIYLISNNY